MSQLPIEFHPHAYYEIEEARDWYLRIKESPHAAARLMDELDSAIERIRTQPERWPKHLSGTRRLMLDRFPYLVIYKVLETSVRIVAVAHARRRPGYWRWRIAQTP